MYISVFGVFSLSFGVFSLELILDIVSTYSITVCVSRVATATSAVFSLFLRAYFVDYRVSCVFHVVILCGSFDKCVSVEACGSFGAPCTGQGCAYPCPAVRGPCLCGISLMLPLDLAAKPKLLDKVGQKA